MKSIALGSLFSAALLLALPAAAQNVERGRELSQTCVACHGATGVSDQPVHPHLAGQHEDYLAYSLRAYRSGARENAIMHGFAANLSDRDIRDLAAYYARQSGPLFTPHIEAR